jgi:hypothetical protein
MHSKCNIFMVNLDGVKRRAARYAILVSVCLFVYVDQTVEGIDLLTAKLGRQAPFITKIRINCAAAVFEPTSSAMQCAVSERIFPYYEMYNLLFWSTVAHWYEQGRQVSNPFMGTADLS